MNMNKNALVTVRIEDIGSDGEGIGKVEGYTLFIKDAIIGDLVEAKIMKAKKNFAYARLEKVIEPSSFRVTPPCEYYRSCGGCQLQALSYEKQLQYKENKVKNHLIRIGGMNAEQLERVWEPIVGMEEPFFYRNKAQFPIGQDRDGNPIAGFYAGRTHSIISNTNCILGVKENQEILETILEFMKEYKISSYDEVSHKGLIRHVLIRKGFYSGQLMVSIVINGDKIPYQEKLVEKLSQIDQMTSITISINKDKTNVIMGKKIVLLWGSDTIEDTLKGIKFRISPLSFYQINPYQTEKLYQIALDYTDLQSGETVWDLYCGIGTISLFLAQKATKVYGVEIIPEAIEDAKANAALNQIKNAEFFVGKAEEVLPKFYEEECEAGRKAYSDVIVVDPPRKGCDSVCLDTMLKMQPERIVYVSCDSATLARDVKILVEGGYEVKKVRAVDQFGQTVHVETVVLMSRKEK